MSLTVCINVRNDVAAVCGADMPPLTAYWWEDAIQQDYLKYGLQYLPSVDPGMKCDETNC